MIYYHMGSITFSYTQHFSPHVELITRDSQAGSISSLDLLQTMVCCSRLAWSKNLPPFSSFHSLPSFITRLWTSHTHQQKRPLKLLPPNFFLLKAGSKNMWAILENWALVSHWVDKELFLRALSLAVYVHKMNKKLWWLRDLKLTQSMRWLSIARWK